MLDLIPLLLSGAISGVSAGLVGLLVGRYIKNSMKNDLKAEIIGFLESEDAPKLFAGIGAAVGTGLFSRAGGLNPMKGNINIMGMKIPKVLAFGFAQKMGWLPKGLGIGEAAPTSPDPLSPIPWVKELGTT